jgi:methylated-DNA-[protein]-cysteine S-methyltransferase
MKANELKRLAEGAEERSRRAGRELAAAAGRAGLIDVAYGFAESPFGSLLVAVSRRGLIRLAYPDQDPELELEDLAREVSPRVLESPRDTDEVRRELDQYFAGERHDFDIPVDFSHLHGFRRRILQATTRIPFGEVATYRQVAGRAGNAQASRAAGNALGSNPIPIVVPCHRVVRTGGALGGYTGGLDRKVVLLTLEGVLEETGE